MSEARAWVIGRAPDCDIVLTQSDVSGRHCRLSRDGSSWVLEDLGSSNGTFVNGRRLAPRAAASVGHGDTITLGATPLPWPERPSAPAPRVARTVLAAPLPDLPEPANRPASPRTPVPAARPPLPARKPSGGNGAGLVIGAVIGVACLGGLVFLFWTPGESKSNEEKDRKEKKEGEKREDKEKPETDKDKRKTPISEDFSEANSRGEGLPRGWGGKDVSIMTDRMKRACLEPTLNTRGVGTAMVALSTIKGDFTIEGDAYVNPTLMFGLEGEGPRLAVTIEASGAVKINDNAPRSPDKPLRPYAFTYKVVRRGSTVRVYLNDELATSATLEKKTEASKLQIGLGTWGERAGNTRLYSVKVTRD